MVLSWLLNALFGVLKIFLDFGIYFWGPEDETRKANLNPKRSDLLELLPGLGHIFGIEDLGNLLLVQQFLFPGQIYDRPARRDRLLH